MISSNSLDALLPVFQALSSEIRVKILNLILANNGISLKQLSDMLHVSISTISPHINRLSECGLIRLEDAPAAHGTQKRCYPDVEQILISFDAKSNRLPVIQSEIPVGCYSDFSVTPTCGLATTSCFLGKLDEPRWFTHPEHYDAEILWFTTGYVEYILPNTVPRHHRIDQLSLSFELSSEAPRHNNDWPSDIIFSLNGMTLGYWTSPGDFGDRRGDLNPRWWYSFLNQYGLLKKLTINTEGTFLDDRLLSRVTVRDLNLTSQSVMKFRFSVESETPHAKGLTLYGRGFGDHNQDIRMSIQYSPEV